jgi:flagellin
MNINSISSLIGNSLLTDLNKTSDALGKTSERLATGLKINRASDDAAGMSIAMRLEAEQRELAMSEKNAQMGVSMIQTAESSLGSVTDDIQRIRELALQASNGTMNDSDRQSIQEEINALKENVDSNLGSAEFNSKKLFSGEKREIMLGPSGQVDVTIPSMTAESLGLNEIDVTTQAGAEQSITASDTALSDVLSVRTDLGATQNQLETSISSLLQTGSDTSKALSVIRDANMAEEALNMVKLSTQLQSQVAVASQVKNLNKSILPLLLGESRQKR